MNEQQPFANPACAHTTFLHLRADGVTLPESVLRAAGAAGKIPSIGCGRKRLFWYANVLRYIEQGDTQESNLNEYGKVRPIRA